MAQRMLVVLVLLLAASVAAGSDKVLHLNHTPSPIVIDGEIDEAWALADSSDDFHQQDPYHGQPPKHRTVVRILTNNASLYCLIVCLRPAGAYPAVPEPP